MYLDCIHIFLYIYIHVNICFRIYTWTNFRKVHKFEMAVQGFGGLSRRDWRWSVRKIVICSGCECRHTIGWNCMVYTYKNIYIYQYICIRYIYLCTHLHTVDFCAKCRYMLNLTPLTINRWDLNIIWSKPPCLRIQNVNFPGYCM